MNFLIHELQRENLRRLVLGKQPRVRHLHPLRQVEHPVFPQEESRFVRADWCPFLVTDELLHNLRRDELRFALQDDLKGAPHSFGVVGEMRPRAEYFHHLGQLRDGLKPLPVVDEPLRDFQVVPNVIVLRLLRVFVLVTPHTEHHEILGPFVSHALVGPVMYLQIAFGFTLRTPPLRTP